MFPAMLVGHFEPLPMMSCKQGCKIGLKHLQAPSATDQEEIQQKGSLPYHHREVRPGRGIQAPLDLCPRKHRETWLGRRPRGLPLRSMRQEGIVGKKKERLVYCSCCPTRPCVHAVVSVKGPGALRYWSTKCGVSRSLNKA